MYQFWYNESKATEMNRSPSKKILEVSFYSETNGNEPVRKWLKALDKESRTVIGKDICTVQEGWPLGMPLVRSVGN